MCWKSGDQLFVVCEVMFIDNALSGCFFYLFAYLPNMTKRQEHDDEEVVSILDISNENITDFSTNGLIMK